VKAGWSWFTVERLLGLLFLLMRMPLLVGGAVLLVLVVDERLVLVGLVVAVAWRWPGRRYVVVESAPASGVARLERGGQRHEGA
jgi:hypothetical protein